MTSLLRQAARVSAGAAVLLLAACDGPTDNSAAQRPTTTARAATSTSTTAAAAKTTYRLVGEPVALIGDTTGGAVFQVRLRFNRKLPTDRQGVLADITLGGAGADSPLKPYGRPSHRCYAAVIGNDFDAPGLRGAKVGSRVALTLRIPAHSGPRLRRTVTLIKMQSPAAATALAALSCGKR